MNKIIGIVSSQSLGGTFLDWSLHFLSGQTQYYHAVLKQWIPLSNDPVNRSNAHGHKKNHPCGYQYAKETIDLFKQSQPALYSYYAGLITPDLIAADLDINVKSLVDHQWEEIVTAQTKNFQAQWQYCCENSNAVIFISLPTHAWLYKFFNRNLDRMLFENRPASSQDEIWQQFDEVFFANSKKIWDHNQLTEIWDRRERMALCWRPFDLRYTQIDQVDFLKSHFKIDSTDLWHNGVDVVKEMMSFCGLEISPSRFQSWQDVYRNWQLIQKPIVDFVYNHRDIIDAIITNKDYALLDLTFEQEVVIQHCLIYQHNLNLKTWQLRKFPTNAQDLHTLLEPNIHPITNGYQ